MDDDQNDWEASGATTPGTVTPDTLSELRKVAVMLRTWFPALLPANAAGQVSFVRMMGDTVADALDRALAEAGARPIAPEECAVERSPPGWGAPDDLIRAAYAFLSSGPALNRVRVDGNMLGREEVAERLANTYGLRQVLEPATP